MFQIHKVAGRKKLGRIMLKVSLILHLTGRIFPPSHNSNTGLISSWYHFYGNETASGEKQPETAITAKMKYERWLFYEFFHFVHISLFFVFFYFGFCSIALSGVKRNRGYSGRVMILCACDHYGDSGDDRTITSGTLACNRREDIVIFPSRGGEKKVEEIIENGE